MSDDESSGPFPSNYTREPSMATEPKIKVITDKLGKGLNISVPWMTVFGMMLTGAFYFLHERDANINRDNAIKTNAEAIIRTDKKIDERADRLERWMETLGWKIDNIPRPSSYNPPARGARP